MNAIDLASSRFSRLVVVALVATAACNTGDARTLRNGPENYGANASVRASTLQTDAQILGLLHQSNVGEIAAGMMAQQRAMNARVRAFADRMVADHGSLDRQGAALAAQIGVTPVLPDSSLPRMQAAEAAQLRAASDSAFDRVYMTQQVMGHRRTLALVDSSITRAQTATLRQALTSVVRPTVAMHLDTAMVIQRTLGGP